MGHPPWMLVTACARPPCFAKRSWLCLSGMTDVVQIAGLLRTRRDGRAPYIVAITGAVAVGKSTFAAELAAAIAAWPEGPTVEVVGIDGFLFPNAVLEARGLLNRKGFPESYDGGTLR